MTTDDRVIAAIARTATAPALSEHWRGLLASRVPGPGASGSVFGDVADGGELVERLGAARWEPLDHPDVRAPAVAFWTRDLVGRLGVVDLATLPPDAVVTLREAHATGYLAAEVWGDVGAESDGATIILGPDVAGEVVWTFHPGLPVAPSSVPVGRAEAGEVVTAHWALALGFRHGKVTPCRS